MNRSLPLAFRDWLFSRAARERPRGTDRPASCVRPCLEELEDRCVPSGTYTGIVFEDFNDNGVFNTTGSRTNSSGVGTIPTARDRPLAGVTVTAYDSSGNARGSTTTSATLVGGANFSLTPAGTGPFRIEFTNLPAGFFPGVHGTNNGTTTQFVADGGATGIDLGLVNPNDYSTDNPEIAAISYLYGDQVNGANKASPVLYGLP